MALVSYSMKSSCWSAGTRPNGCRPRCIGRYISSSVSWKRYATFFAVRIRPATLTKVLRGNPKRVTLNIGFSNAAAGSETVGEKDISPKALGPTSGRSAVLGRYALSSRATAMQPDAGYVMQYGARVKTSSLYDEAIHRCRYEDRQSGRQQQEQDHLAKARVVELAVKFEAGP